MQMAKIKGLHGPDFSGQGLVRPVRGRDKNKARPSPKRNTKSCPGSEMAIFYSDFCPDSLYLSDFKNQSIQLFAHDKLIFLLMICNLLKQFI